MCMLLINDSNIAEVANHTRVNNPSISAVIISKIQPPIQGQAKSILVRQPSCSDWHVHTFNHVARI